ncbi:MAG: 23S rRNA (adenine(2503)-C(2))-methyltransferase RlmN, partial [Verrucomicrobiae bacterium]|nr:23S rRNA (adenine(2503)-C(2))-methyltransferase RlmN [Verrucomicrobiae bacterium]
MKPDLKSLSLTELSNALAADGEPSYRATQVMEWAYGRAAESFAAMSNLPLALRRSLASEFDLWTLKELRESRSTDTTEKFLWQLRDGQLIET